MLKNIQLLVISSIFLLPSLVYSSLPFDTLRPLEPKYNGDHVMTMIFIQHSGFKTALKVINSELVGPIATIHQIASAIFHSYNIGFNENSLKSLRYIFMFKYESEGYWDVDKKFRRFNNDLIVKLLKYNHCLENPDIAVQNFM